MVYTIAAYHDLGMCGHRADHHIRGGKILASDARLKKLTLTDKALDMYHELVMQLKVQEDIIKEGITEDELNVFYGVLEKIRNNIGTDRAVSADRNEVDEA